MAAMSESDANKSKRKSPMFVRLIGVLMLLGILVANVLLFLQSYPVDLKWVATVGGSVLVFVLVVWSVAKIYPPRSKLPHSRAFRLLLALFVLLISSVVSYWFIFHG